MGSRTEQDGGGGLHWTGETGLQDWMGPPIFASHVHILLCEKHIDLTRLLLQDGQDPGSADVAHILNLM